MANNMLRIIKDCHSVFSDGQYVLLAGRKLWIFRTDDTFIAKLELIRKPSKAVFLPNNTALVDGDGDGHYHYISLENGELLWSSIKKGRRHRPVKRFAVSSDGTTIYDVYYKDSNSLYVDLLIPEKHLHISYVVNEGFSITHDIFCNQNDALCILQSQIQMNSNTLCTHHYPSIRQNGILKVLFGKEGVKTHWEKLWQSNSGSDTVVRGCDGENILQSDFSVINLNTMNTYPLLDKDEMDKLPKDSFFCSYDLKRHLLTVYFLAERINAIIDCQSRKVVGLYNGDKLDVGYTGCLIHNAFWIGTCEGVVKKPFPSVNECL